MGPEKRRKGPVLFCHHRRLDVRTDDRIIDLYGNLHTKELLELLVIRIGHLCTPPNLEVTARGSRPFCMLLEKYTNFRTSHPPADAKIDAE